MIIIKNNKNECESVTRKNNKDNNNSNNNAIRWIFWSW